MNIIIALICKSVKLTTRFKLELIISREPEFLRFEKQIPFGEQLLSSQIEAPRFRMRETFCTASIRALMLSSSNVIRVTVILLKDPFYILTIN